MRQTSSRHFGWWQRTVAIATLAAVVSPAIRDRDSFPLSTYPMYADRGTRFSTLATAIGVDGTGAHRRLSLATIAMTDDPLIAESSVDEAIRAGRADALCQQIARRAPGGVVRVEVVRERHDVIARTKGEDSLLERRVEAGCEVGR